MKRFVANGLATILAAWLGPGLGHCHEHEVEQERETRHRHEHAAASQQPTDGKLSGQAAMQFSWDQELTARFPLDAAEFESKMHGGFSEDPQTGIVYTGIPGYGLCSISPDLQQWQRIGNDARLKSNIHGICFFVHHGEKRLALAQNKAARILIVDLSGQVLHSLDSPAGGEFQFKTANAYYGGEDAKFVPTDVTYLNGRLYATTGYSPGDFVLTAVENDGAWSWGKLAWGGRGNSPDQLQTGHGIFAFDKSIFVASRAASRIIEFSPQGELIGEFEDIPESSLVCNVAHTGDYFLINALRPLGGESSAPIYAYTGNKLVSTIVPGDLQIPVLKNLHHTWPHVVTDEDGRETLYLLIHGWNAGKYAVLKHESRN